MRTRTVIDVSALPKYAFGHRSLMWWGTLGMIAIESTVFALALASYYYLRTLSPQPWPLAERGPALLYGTLNTFVLLASAVPNEWTKRAAQREDLRRVRIGLLTSIAFGIAFVVVRAFEFGALGVHWYDNAYGSIVFGLLVLHTAHLVTDFADTIVLTVLLHTRHVEGKRFVDVSENCVYWWFVVVSWLPIYATIYLAPRVG